MVQINIKTDCGNAPKKEFIRDFQVAYAKQDAQAVLSSLEEKAIWDMVGHTVFEGKEAIREALPSMFSGTVLELTMDNIITHGKVGSANGVMKYEDGAVIAFCDVFEFTSHAKDAKLKKISSYAVDLKEV